jgi:hypothetical protein
MTPNERAKKVANELQGDLFSATGWPDVELIERAIVAAVEEDRASRECCKVERQACAQIADELRNSFPDSDLHAISRKAMAARIRDRIRARSEGEKNELDN